jgi:hypothetical protein
MTTQSEAIGCVSDRTVAICYGPKMEDYHRKELGERWCFVCRKRRSFAMIFSAPVGLSYYGPEARIECDRGHYDGDCFPGRYREWEEA